jgi:putative endonuclease
LGHDRQRLGREAEAAALAFLRAKGLELVASNYRCRGGELDLVMHDGDTLVFVEVRYRSRGDYGGPIESIDRRKRRRLVTAARHFLQRHRWSERPCRFDVIGVVPQPGAPIEWLADAFAAGD